MTRSGGGGGGGKRGNDNGSKDFKKKYLRGNDKKPLLDFFK